MKKLLYIVLLLVIKVTWAQAPTANELVSIHSATLAEITAMASPIEGSLIYNTNDKFLYQFNGTLWQKLTPEGNETKIVANDNVSISGTGTTADPYVVSSIKSTFTTNPDGSFTFSNGIDPDVNFSPTVPGNTPIVSNSNAGIGNCSQFGLSETRDLIIQGAYFDGASTVAITGQTVNSVVINSSSQITANVTTGGAYGNFDISVTNNAGLSTLAGGFVLQASSPLTTNSITATDMVLTGSMTYDGNILTKTATAGWNAQGYSLNHEISNIKGGRLDFTPNQTNLLAMIGLSYDPSSSASYPNLNYAMYIVSNSQIQIRESGASLGYVSSYAAGDVLSIDVDCLGNVTYLRNDNIIFTSSRKAVSPLYFDSSFYHIGMKISNILMKY
ncbi:hypothetical protein [Zobellia barbeyronii]|uniref:B30.2/SPRY domain-containing protein n=1 Tax=Zobellia barbeyronii TaxID=2748009 RepID=A0ABS5WER4_9FLAO|nr:hypothetical protein [Zobellia barbeyronii]MBT2161889.1 hypothetical protein [Zobellia barbeyronii]